MSEDFSRQFRSILAFASEQSDAVLAWVRARINEPAADEERAALFYLKAYLTSDDHLAAIQAYKQALGGPLYDWLRPMALYGLAYLWRTIGERSEAKDAFHKCVEEASKQNQPGAEARALEHLSSMAEEDGDVDQAINLAHRANKSWLETTEDDEIARSHRRTGEILAGAKFFAEAAASLQTARDLYLRLELFDLVVPVTAQLAETHVADGDHDRAISLIEEAALIARTKHPELLPKVLYSQGRILCEKEPTLGLEALSEAVALAEQVDDMLTAGQASGDLAIQCYLAARFEDAGYWTERSVALYRESGNQHGELLCHLNLGRFQLDNDDPRALDSLAKARPLAIALGKLDELALLSHGVAEKFSTPESSMTSLLDLLASMRSSILKAASSVAEFDQRYARFCDDLVNHLAEVFTPDQALSMLVELVRHPNAADDTRQAYALCAAGLKRFGNHDGVELPALRLKFGSMLLRIGDPRSARLELARAVSESRRFGATGSLCASLSELARAEHALGRVMESIALLEEAIKAAQSSEEADSVKLNLATMHMALWAFDKAEPLLEELTASAERRGDAKLRIVANCNLAAVQADAGRTAVALSTVQQISQMDRSVLRRHDVAGVLRLQAHVYATAGQLDEALGLLEEAAKSVENTRLDLSSTGLQASYSTSSHRVFADAVRYCFDADPAKALLWAERSRARAIANAIFHRQPSDSSSIPDDLLRRAQGKLGSDEVLVEYFLTGDSLYCWVVGNNQFVSVKQELKLEDLIAVVAKYRKGFENGIDDEYCRERLSNWLIDPIPRAAMEAAQTIFFVPHGPLHEVPFAALGGQQRLVETFDSATLPSLHLLDVRPTRSESWADHLRIFADSLDDLPAARIEGQSLLPMFPQASLSTGREVSRSELMESFLSASAIHFAGHAFFDVNDPLNSGLLLRSTSGGLDTLSVADVLQLESVNACLLMLSACETRLQVGAESDDGVGLPTAFLMAGVETIIGAMWKVPDEETRLLMLDLYAELRNKESPIRSLAIAQRKATAARRPTSGWAAFNVFTIASGRRFRARFADTNRTDAN